MNAPAHPPVVAAPQGKANADEKRRWMRPRLSRPMGCLGVWLLFLTPVAWTLSLAAFPAAADWVQERTADWPPLARQWIGPGPAKGVGQWLANVEPGGTMVYLIAAAVLVLLTAAVFVRDEPKPAG